MVKTKELSYDIRIAINSKHKTSKGYKAISKDLSTVNNVIKKFAKHCKNLPGRTGKRKTDERTLRRLVRMVEKNTTSNIQRPEGQPGTVWGHGFNKYYTPHTKPSRASWTKVKEDTIVEEKTYKRND